MGGLQVLSTEQTAERCLWTEAADLAEFGYRCNSSELCTLQKFSKRAHCGAEGDASAPAHAACPGDAQRGGHDAVREHVRQRLHRPQQDCNMGLRRRQGVLRFDVRAATCCLIA